MINHPCGKCYPFGKVQTNYIWWFSFLCFLIVRCDDVIWYLHSLLKTLQKTSGEIDLFMTWGPILFVLLEWRFTNYICPSTSGGWLLNLGISRNRLLPHASAISTMIPLLLYGLVWKQGIPIHIVNWLHIKTGWWFEPFWNILVNWDDYSQYMGK